MGYTYAMGTYLHFSVDGSIETPYHEILGIQSQLAIPPHFFLPIQFTTTVASVVVLTAPPSVVLEGQPFSIQPVIKVLDQDGNPLAGKLVFALRCGEGGRKSPSYYGLRQQGTIWLNNLGYIPKDIMYPIPGNYSSNFLNAIKSHEFTPYYTNASGIVNYTNLQFSGPGYASVTSSGTYAIVFICDGVESDRFTIQVTSRLASVAFVEQVTTPFSVIPDDTIQLHPVIGLKDFNGNLVAGKMPLNVSIVASNPQYANLVAGYMDTGNEAFQTSGKDGLFVLYYRISYISLSGILCRLQVRFDDIVVLSNEFELDMDQNSVDSSVCTGISITSPSDSALSVVRLYSVKI